MKLAAPYAERYHQLRRLGGGAQGAVYRAEAAEGALAETRVRQEARQLVAGLGSSQDGLAGELLELVRLRLASVVHAERATPHADRKFKPPFSRSAFLIRGSSDLAGRENTEAGALLRVR